VSELRSTVKLAILDAVAKVPGAALTGNWQGVSGALRSRVYAEVAERLVQRDRGTAAAALVTALLDGGVGRGAWQDILFGWARDRVQDGGKLSLLAGALEDGRLSREEVVAAAAAWARGQVDDEAALALLAVLEDGRLEEGELKSGLLAAAAELAGDSEVAAALSAALADGTLGRAEAIGVLVAWGQRQIRDETLRSVFTALAAIGATGGDRQAVEAVLLRVLQESGVGDNVVEALLAGVRDGRLDAAEILLILTTWAAAAGSREPAELAELASRAGAGDPLAVAEALLRGGLPPQSEELLRRLLAEDWLGVLSALLGTLELGLAGRLLRGLAGGRFRDAAVRELTQLLERAGLEQAGVVADAIVDIATGARSLFAEGEEADSGLTNPVEIALWREIRQVLFMAQLATFGGALVPTGAQDRPHIFAAAAIRFRTKLAELVPDGTDEEAKKLFCNTVTAFLDRQFGSRMRRRFQDEPVLAIDLNDIRPDGNSARIVFVKVRRRLGAAA
jgi:hypothetical protein